MFCQTSIDNLVIQSTSTCLNFSLPSVRLLTCNQSSTNYILLYQVLFSFTFSVLEVLVQHTLITLFVLSLIHICLQLLIRASPSDTVVVLCEINTDFSFLAYDALTCWKGSYSFLNSFISENEITALQKLYVITYKPPTEYASKRQQKRLLQSLTSYGGLVYLPRDF